MSDEIGPELTPDEVQAIIESHAKSSLENVLRVAEILGPRPFADVDDDVLMGQRLFCDLRSSFSEEGEGILSSCFVDSSGVDIEFPGSDVLWKSTKSLYDKCTKYFNDELTNEKLAELVLAANSSLDQLLDIIQTQLVEPGVLILKGSSIQQVKEWEYAADKLRVLLDILDGYSDEDDHSEEFNESFGRAQLEATVAFYGLADVPACWLGDVDYQTDPSKILLILQNISQAEITISSALAVINDRRAKSTRAANARHKEHRDLKADGMKYYSANLERLASLSNAAVGREITRQVPITERQATKWVSEKRRAEKEKKT